MIGESKTCSAPSLVGRASGAELEHAHAAVKASPLLKTMMDAFPGMVAVLNRQRQVVALNRGLAEKLDVTSVEQVLGLRPGEGFNCVHAGDGTDGCGTGRGCATCGALEAVWASQVVNQQVIRDFRIRTTSGDSMEFTVAATPIDVDGDRMTIVVLGDRSEAERRAVLERVFFHDVLNTATGLSERVEALQNNGTSIEHREELLNSIRGLAGILSEEIRGQQLLMLAERGELQPEFREVQVSRIASEVYNLYSRHASASDRRIEIQVKPGLVVISDAALLRRVLGNLLRNALEACQANEAVRFQAVDDGEAVIFAIWNPGVMSEDVQLHIFQRSFSTKGEAGRGVGAYGVKLFVERYMGGEVDFESNPETGTTFRVTLPKNGPPR